MDQAEIRECMQADLEAAGLDSAKYFGELWRCIICGFQHPDHETAVFHIKHTHPTRIETPLEWRKAMP